MASGLAEIHITRCKSLRVQIVTKKVGQVFEADIRSYFTRINHQWLREMVAQRIADPVILRLIGKWLNAGAMQDGVVTYAEEGTPQGGSISPVLSNLYLHFVLDLWFEKKIKPQCRGEAYLVRFADDFVVSFQYRQDVDHFQQQVRERFTKFGLELAEEKTRRILFGRFADLTCQWGGSKRAICSDSHPQCQELSEVPGANTGVDLSAQTLEKMGATGTSDEDVTRLLSVLWAASLRAQAQLGTATSTAPVDMRLESSRATAPDELDAAKEMLVVPTAVCSKPTPYGLNDAYFRQCHLGSPVRKLHAGFCLGRREQEAMPTR